MVRQKHALPLTKLTGVTWQFTKNPTPIKCWTQNRQSKQRLILFLFQRLT